MADELYMEVKFRCSTSTAPASPPPPAALQPGAHPDIVELNMSPERMRFPKQKPDQDGKCTNEFMNMNAETGMCEYTSKPCSALNEQNTFINKCFSSIHQLEYAQQILSCANPWSQFESCKAVLDDNRQTHVRIKPSGSITLQWTAPKNYTHLEVFRPPTSAGGTETLLRNHFYFQVQCFIGNNPGEDLWKTVFDNTEDSHSIAAGDLEPGMKSYWFTSACPKPSTTWRVADITPSAVSQDVYTAVFELLFKGSPTFIDLGATFPRIGAMRMSVNATAVVTKMGQNTAKPLSCLATGGADRDEDLSIMHRFGSISCSALQDGDVNTPVIFTNSKQAGTQNEAQVITSGEERTYSRIFLYDHPTGVGRLTKFDLSCQQPSGSWKIVLSQSDSQFGMFSGSSASGKWEEFTFSEPCTSKSFKIHNMNGGPTSTSHSWLKTPSLYIFEFVFAGAAAPSLPEVKEARIQGWCVKQQALIIPGTVRLTACSKKADPLCDQRWENLGYLGNVSVNELMDIPCASDYAIDISLENQQITANPAWLGMRKHARDHLIAKREETKTMKDSMSAASKFTVIVVDGGCQRQLEFTGEGGTDRWGTRCLLENHPYRRTKHCKGRTLGPQMANLRTMRKTPGQLKFYVKMSTSPTSDSTYEAWGKAQVTHWYKPPLGMIDCTVPLGELQYVSDA
jgi:hypothetical protein